MSVSRVLMLLMIVFTAGCGGDDGPPRYQLKGKVTFKGQPVPAGSISFSPDSLRGNSGPQGTAPIKDGMYDTRIGGIGHVGGSMVISIDGYEPSAPGGDMDAPKPTLFREYRTAVDLPKENSTKDFDVPAEAANPKKVPRNNGA